MKKYVITPRRGLWWIDAVYADDNRQKIISYPSEKAALKRLHELQEMIEAREMRQIARETSRLWITPSLLH